MMMNFSTPSLTSPYYPSLSSPVGCVLTSRTALNKPSVFDRLQEDTEKRMRTRLESYSNTKLKYRSTTPIAALVRHRNLSRASSRPGSEAELTFKPSINQNSIKIFNDRYMTKAKLSKNRQVLYTDEEYSNAVEFEDVNFTEFDKRFDRKNKADKTDELRRFDRNVKGEKKEEARRIEKKEGNTQQQWTDRGETLMVTDRKYVPMFSKPFDVGKILGKQKESLKKKEVKKVATEVRPLLRPISESTIKIEDNELYQKIVKDRMVKLREMKSTSGKITYK